MGESALIPRGARENEEEYRLENMQPTRMKPEHSEVAYHGTLTGHIWSVLDAPGRICQALLDSLQQFGVTLDAFSFDEGAPSDRSVSCDLDNIGAEITVWVDQVRVAFSDLADITIDHSSQVVDAVCEALKSENKHALFEEHSVSFEIHLAVDEPRYRELLNPLSRVPPGFPKGTEAGVAWYLPEEPQRGYRTSLVVLGRSSPVEQGFLIINAKLNFDGKAIGAGASLSAGRKRIDELLEKVHLELVDA